MSIEKNNQETDYSSDVEKVFISFDDHSTNTEPGITQRKKLSDRLIVSAAKLEIESITLKEQMKKSIEFLDKFPVNEISGLSHQLNDIQVNIETLKDAQQNTKINLLNQSVNELCTKIMSNDTSELYTESFNKLSTVMNDIKTMQQNLNDRNNFIQTRMNDMTKKMDEVHQQISNYEQNSTKSIEFLEKFTPRIINLEKLYETIKMTLVEQQRHLSKKRKI